MTNSGRKVAGLDMREAASTCLAVRDDDIGYRTAGRLLESKGASSMTRGRKASVRRAYWWSGCVSKCVYERERKCVCVCVCMHVLTAVRGRAVGIPHS